MVDRGPFVTIAGRLLVVLALCAGAARAQSTLTLTAPDGLGGDKFGISLSLDGDDAVFGASGANNGLLPDTGAAYLRHWDGTGWIPGETLRLDDGVPLDQFGARVGLRGDLCVVGVPGRKLILKNSAGAIQVYRRIDRTWTLVQVLVAPDPAAFDLFGGAFALTHDRIVVGVAAKDVSLESQQGEVYVWRFNGTAFELEQQLFASDGAAGDKFGTSVDIDADRIVVGAPGEDSHNDTDNGAMYVFRRVGGTWLERQKIRASDGESLDAFGTSVAVDGSLVIAGAPDADGPLLPGRGAAYVYQFGGAVFAEEVKLVPSNGLAGDAFGTTVDIDGGVAVVGAPRDDVGLLVDSGSVWLYRKGSDSWSGEAVWAPADISASAQYGAALAMDSGLVLVGAPSDAVGTSAVQGSACLAKTQPPDWNWIGHSLAGTQGAPDLVGSGSLETGSGIGLSIDDARGAAPVILCISAVQITLPFKGGVMVPAPDILLAGLPTDVWGALQLSGAWPGGVPSGLPIIWQAWVPDPSAGQGFSATNAITCTVP